MNLRAAALPADLHDAFKESGYGGHDLRVLLVRLVFILFADDDPRVCGEDVVCGVIVAW